jgi:hypothetical protein
MTHERAEAYGRVMAIIDGAAELRSGEQRQLRASADALLFARAPDAETSQALSEIRALAHALTDSGRWSPQRAGDLLAAMRACGPEGLLASLASPAGPRFARRSGRLGSRR